MSQYEGLIKAILDNPDDDTARLITADWLEDHGDTQCEFIRLQCALADPDLSWEENSKLRSRQQELIQQLGNQWAGALAQFCESWTFHHGVLD